MRKIPTRPTGTEPYRVVAVGDTIISEQGLVAIIGRDPRYHVCGAAHTFEEANKLVRQHRPDVLLIEPFLENRDAIRWINDLATEFPRIRILIVSRQSERTYAERALCAGASGYWMKTETLRIFFLCREKQMIAPSELGPRHRSRRRALAAVGPPETNASHTHPAMLIGEARIDMRTDSNGTTL